MLRAFHVLTFLLVAAIFAGCVADAPDDGDVATEPVFDELGRLVTTASLSVVDAAAADSGVGDAVEVEVHAAAGAIGTVGSPDSELHVAFPASVWTVTEGSAADKLRLVPPREDPLEVAAGETLRFLVPPFAESIDLLVHAPGAEGKTVTIDTPWNATASLVNGERVLELMEVQERDFPHRTPYMPNYQKFQDYAQQFFRDLGYPQVENDPYDVDQIPMPTPVPGGRAQPASFANVWAYRPGTSDPDRIVAFGGHYDMVENTKHAAFDDTSGTIATMVLAELFAQFETDVGLFFGLWGGEEDGILGSQFFVRTNPDLVKDMVTYVNLDVISLAWPGPVDDPDPIVLAAGPDGPVSDSLLAQGGAIYHTYVPEMPAELLRLEPVAEGQACGTTNGCAGAGVNAQSDHTPFITAGVPSFFVFDGNVENVFEFIHGPQDTLYNMTWYMGTGEVLSAANRGGENPPMTPEQEETGRRLLAQSFESMMVVGWYYAHEVDNGLYVPPVKG